MPGKRNRSSEWTWKSPVKKCHLDDDDEEFVGSSKAINVVGNHIYFNSLVTDESIGEMINAINNKNFEFRMIQSHELVGKMEPAPLYLHINTDGGSLFPAMSAVDTIKKSKLPIFTVVDGRASSAGSVIAMSGHKRFMTRHSYVMIHQLRTGVIGTYSNISEEYINSTQFMEDLITLYAEHTRLSPKTLRKLLKKDIFWNQETCLHYGLVDEPWEDHDPANPYNENNENNEKMDLSELLIEHIYKDQSESD